MPAPFYNLGVCAMREGNRDRAMHYFQTAAGLDPTAMKPRIEIGNILMQLGKVNEAMEGIFAKSSSSNRIMPRLTRISACSSVSRERSTRRMGI